MEGVGEAHGLVTDCRSSVVKRHFHNLLELFFILFLFVVVQILIRLEKKVPRLEATGG